MSSEHGDEEKEPGVVIGWVEIEIHSLEVENATPWFVEMEVEGETMQSALCSSKAPFVSIKKRFPITDIAGSGSVILWEDHRLANNKVLGIIMLSWPVLFPHFSGPLGGGSARLLENPMEVFQFFRAAKPLVRFPSALKGVDHSGQDRPPPEWFATIEVKLELAVTPFEAYCLPVYTDPRSELPDWDIKGLAVQLAASTLRIKRLVGLNPLPFRVSDYLHSCTWKNKRRAVNFLIWSGITTLWLPFFLWPASVTLAFWCASMGAKGEPLLWNDQISDTRTMGEKAQDVLEAWNKGTEAIVGQAALTQNLVTLSLLSNKLHGIADTFEKTHHACDDPNIAKFAQTVTMVIAVAIGVAIAVVELLTFLIPFRLLMFGACVFMTLPSSKPWRAVFPLAFKKWDNMWDRLPVTGEVTHRRLADLQRTDGAAAAALVSDMGHTGEQRVSAMIPDSLDEGVRFRGARRSVLRSGSSKSSSQPGDDFPSNSPTSPTPTIDVEKEKQRFARMSTSMPDPEFPRGGALEPPNRLQSFQKTGDEQEHEI